MLHWLDTSLYVGLPYALVTLSFLLTFQYLRFPDITCASTFVLGAAAAAFSIVHMHFNPYLGLLIAMAAGGLGGCLTALIHLVLKVDRLLAGILSTFAIYSVNLLILRPTIPYELRPTVLTYWESWDKHLSAGGVLPWHVGSILFLLVLIGLTKVALDLLLSSEVGLCFRAMEDEIAGPVLLVRLGIAPWKMKALGLAAGNGLVALAGAIGSMCEGAANAHRGFDVLITGLIAYLIGSKLGDWARFLRRHLLSGISSRWEPAPTTTAILGPLLYFSVISASYRLEIAPEYAKLCIALFVAVAVGDKSFLTRLRDVVYSAQRSTAEDQEVQCHGGPLLSVSGLKFTYNNGRRVTALSNVSFEIDKCGLVLLDGANGSGKSTLLRLLGGTLEAPDSGTICIGDRNVASNVSVRRSLCVYLDQDPRRNLIETMPIEESLCLWSFGRAPSILRRAINSRRRARIRELCMEASLSVTLLGSRPNELSGGQRQLASILSILTMSKIPRLACLDEPLNNLDESHAATCIGLIHRLCCSGIAVIMVSHTHREELKPDVLLTLDSGMVAPAPPTNSH